MKARKGSVAPLLLIVLLVSVALNMYLFRERGRIILENRQAKPAPQAMPSYVREMASALGVNPGSGRTDADITTDVKLMIQDAPEAPKKTLTDANIAKLSKLLKPEEREVLAEGQKFLKQVAGKQVLMIVRD